MNTIATQITSKVNTLQRPFIVGICGGSASGKSTYSNLLAQELQKSGCHITIIHLDDFAIGRNFKNKHDSLYKWDDPENYRLSECVDLIHKLTNGRSASFLAYTLQAHEPVLHTEIKSHAVSDKPYVIIVEGIFAWYGPLQSAVDYKIYLEADFYRRFVLRLNRNVYESKHADVDTVVRQYLTHVARAQFDLLDPLKNTADAVINQDIPLPTTTINIKSNNITNYIHRNSELLIGLSTGKPWHLVIIVHDSVLFNLPINEESVRILLEWTRTDQSTLQRKTL